MHDLAALQQRAQEAFRAGEYADAVGALEQLVAARPEVRAFRYTLALALARTREWDRVSALLKELLQEPDAVSLRLQALVALELGFAEDACQAAERAYGLSGSEDDLQLAADAAAQAGQIERALDLFSTLEQFSESAEISFQVGVLAYILGDTEAATKAFSHAVDKNPFWPEALANAALCHLQAGHIEDAEQAVARALELKADLPLALSLKAELAVRKQDWSGALDCCARLIEGGERSAELFYNTGLLLEKQNQTDDAMRLFEEALRERAEFAEALLHLSHLLEQKDEAAKARQLRERARQLMA